MSVYYTDSARASVDLDTAISGGVATEDIYRLDYGYGYERKTVFLKAGESIPDTEVTMAKREQTVGVPPAAAPSRVDTQPHVLDQIKAVDGRVTAVDARVTSYHP